MEDDLAVLPAGETTYFSKSPKGCAPFLSAPVVLIQGIYDRKPELARRIVRHRIFTSAPSSAALQGLIRVAAKRITAELPLTDFVFRSSESWIQIEAASIAFPETLPLPGSPVSPSDDAFMKIARDLALSISRQKARHECDRPIAAILVSGENKILASAVNTNARNRTLHAEMNLLRQFHEKTGNLLPPRSRIYTTLKPCKMCAGMIWDCAQDRASLQVIYAENDPGTNARHTALDVSPFPIQKLFS